MIHGYYKSIALQMSVAYVIAELSIRIISNWQNQKCTYAKIYTALRIMLGYVMRGLGYLDGYISDGYAISDRKMISTYLVILTLYEQ